MGNIKYKSKGEELIGKFLSEKKLSFTYERPLLINKSGQLTIWYPDFYLNDFNIAIEYFGMATEHSGYERSMKFKQAIYHQNKIDFIGVYKRNLDELESYLKTRLVGTINKKLSLLDRKGLI